MDPLFDVQSQQNSGKARREDQRQAKDKVPAGERKTKEQQPLSVDQLR